MMDTFAMSNYRNVGRIDAVIRIVVALSLLAVVISLDLSPVASFALAILSIPIMLFALTRWDPIYSLLGFGTNKDELEA